MKNVWKVVVGVLVVVVGMVGVRGKVVASNTYQVEHIVGNVAANSQAKVNNVGDVVWVSSTESQKTLNLYNHLTQSVQSIYTLSSANGELSFGDFSINDLGDVVWEVADAMRYSVYYKSYDSTIVNYIGRSVLGNSSGVTQAQKSFPKLNNNRLIVVKGLVSGVQQGAQDLAVMQIPNIQLTPITINLTNNFFKTMDVKLNSNNLISIIYATNSPTYSNGSVRIIKFYPNSQSYSYIYQYENAYPFNPGVLTDDNSLYYSNLGEIFKADCSSGSCIKYDIGSYNQSMTSNISAYDANNALWYISSNILRYYDGASTFTTGTTGLYPHYASFVGDGQALWFDNQNGIFTLVSFDFNSLLKETLFNVNSGYFLYDMNVSNQGNGVFIVGNGTSSDIYTVRKVMVNSDPASKAGNDENIDEGSKVILDGSGSTDPDGIADIVSYNWDFGDGQYGSGMSANHVYADDGIYTATLTVMDTAGHVASDTAVVTVNNVAPVVGNLSSMSSVLPGITVTTSASFSDAGVNDTHTALFDWGDGNSSVGTIGSGVVSGSHVYTTPGVYTVVLTVTDDDSGSGSTSASVTILTPAQATQNLVDLVQTYNLQQGITNSLDAKLDAALGTLDDLNQNNNGAAINALQAFINAVEAQRGSHITDAQADQLVHDAQQILNNL